MKIVEIGSLRMIYGDSMPRVGIIIECTQEEAIASSFNLYRDVEIKSPEIQDPSSQALLAFMTRIARVDNRIRKEKISKRYTRDEVLAMLDEIDPNYFADDMGERK